MKKSLALKTEHLTELTADELTYAVGGTYTGQLGCILSYDKPCQSVATLNLSCVNY